METVYRRDAKEKDDAVSNLWKQYTEEDDAVSNLRKQYTEEMRILEGNTLTIHGEQCTIEFQPSADQAWQFWANNVLTQAATYPSMYAKVHKSQLAFINGTIGNSSSDTWAPPSKESRANDLKKLDNFREELNSKNLSCESLHKKELEFMAKNGLQQIGEPRIGPYVNLQRPEPLHLDVNHWEHLLFLLHIEALQNSKMEIFLSTLASSVVSGGCGLHFTATQIRGHYNQVTERFKIFPSSCQLIGDQAIELARRSLLIIDALKYTSNSDLQSIRLFILSKLCQTLRKIGILINVVEGSDTYLFALYFKDRCNSTVWTLCYVVPYHAKKLWEEYQVGYGIISMQGKEPKHSAIKATLKSSTSNSTSHDEKGKWHQLARGRFVRTFYLPYHFPTDAYVSHSKSRNPPVDENANACGCFRPIESHKEICFECLNLLDITDNAISGVIPVNKIITPIQCEKCSKLFADIIRYREHFNQKHIDQNTTISSTINAKSMNVEELKTELRCRGLPTVGNKKALCQRLEDYLHINL